MITVPQPNKKIVDEYFDIVKVELTNQLEKVSEKGYREGTVKVLPDELESSFLKRISNEKLLKLIVTSLPEDLPIVIAKFQSYSPTITSRTDSLNRFLHRVFVKRIYDVTKKFDKHKFVNYHENSTCSYCNRNYIFSLSKNSKLKPEIDHFYPKDKYPFLALSFYNLIPSCQTCNGIGGKHNRDPLTKGIVSPYLVDDKDFEFDYILKPYRDSSPLYGLDVKLFLKKKVRGNNKAFKLNKLYKKHSDHLIDLIVKSKLEYHKKYRASLKSYKGIKFKDSEIDRMIVGNYTELEDLHKRPLSKMYRDISIKLGLIKV